MAHLAGGFGKVYKVASLRDGSEFALKVRKV